MQGRSVFHSRALRVAAALCVVLTPVFSSGSFASASTPAKAKPTVKQAPALATLKIQQAKVSIAHKGKKKFVIAKNGQVLRQGDTLRTDTAGKAEIDYTDGSLTRLGPSTVFTISKLTNKRGGRQTQGTLDVGQTWSRAAKVSETGSFEVKAGGTTAAVEGTAFALSCTKQGTERVCTVIDVVDSVKVTTTDGTSVTMLPATSLEAINDLLGKLTQLTYEDLVNNPFIVSNLGLDLQLLKGKGFGDLPTPPTSTSAPPGTAAPGGTDATGTAGGTTPTDVTEGTEPPASSEPPASTHGTQRTGDSPPGDSGPPAAPPVFVLPPAAEQCFGNGYLSLVGSGGETFATAGDCILFVVGGGTFATGIVIPAGQVVTIEFASFDACNDLNYGYQLNFGANVIVDSKPYGCFSEDAGSVTIPAAPTAQLLRVFLIDDHCGSTFFSDGGHGLVTGVDPWKVDITDAGFFCEYPPEYPPLGPGQGNLSVTVHTGPPEEGGGES